MLLKKKNNTIFNFSFKKHLNIARWRLPTCVCVCLCMASHGATLAIDSFQRKKIVIYYIVCARRKRRQLISYHFIQTWWPLYWFKRFQRRGGAKRGQILLHRVSCLTFGGRRIRDILKALTSSLRDVFLDLQISCFLLGSARVDTLGLYELM